ncbi:membrane bound O-acyl transferase family-domain-containing protein [Coniochaeta sp. 2T2.1]|nr:membrane bound O-acyl transferase family-domain-containing protein [Coniochaeta sp. 2T2.1]
MADNGSFFSSNTDASSTTTTAKLRNVLSHPLTGALAQTLLSVIMMGFTKPRSMLRLAFFPLIVLIAIAHYRTTTFHSWGAVASGLFQAYVSCYPVYYSHYVLFRRFAFDAGGPSSSHSFTSNNKHNDKSRSNNTSNADTEVRRGSAWSRLLFGLKVHSYCRYPTTPYEVPNCPHWSDTDESYAPSRSVYLLRTIALVVSSLLFMDFQMAFKGLDPNAPVPRGFEVSFFSRLGDLTMTMVAERLLITPIIWISMATGVQIIYSVCGLLFVCLGFSEPRQCPPLYGQLSDLYSVRNFWGTVWHQLIRRFYNDPAIFLAHDVLGLPATGLTQRYFKIFVTFFVSGFAHALGDAAARNVSWAESGCVRFFCTQTVGIIIEDGVQEIWRRIYGGVDGHGIGLQKGQKPGSKSIASKRPRPAVWKRVVGFLWVWAFLAWTTPSWFYPIMSHKRAELERAFPWSVGERVLGVQRKI